MRNLKRALSLTLASVMLLGMMVVGSSAAAGYDDVSETDNVEAIEVLQAIEVMVGDERGFGPERPVNRAEMAVVMGKLLSLDYNYYSTSCPFNDVYDWAQGWVGACAANGIVSGRGEGVYDPGATVTAVEAASMLMRALGYFKYQNDYADGFEVSTVRQGTIIGIFDNVGSSATEPMTRNQVAQMVLNALQSAVVEPDGNTINLTTPDGTVLTGKVNYVSVTSNKPFARAISTVQATSIGSTNDSTIVELGERLYDGDLRLTAYDTDAFQRPARTWEYDGKEIGTYVKKELLRESYTEKVTGRMLYDLLTKNTIDTYDFVIAIDGETDQTYLDTHGYYTKGNLIRSNTEAVAASGKGVLTEVYVDTKAEIVYIATINTYLAKANADYNEKKDEVTFEVWSLYNEGTSTDKHLVKVVPATNAAKQSLNLTVKDEDFDVADVKEGDIVLVNVAEGEVKKIFDPEVIDDTTITSFKKGSWVNAGGTQYDYAHTAQYDEEVLDDYDQVNMKDTNYRVFLDQYGYMIGLEILEAPSQYAFLAGIDGRSSNIDNKTARGNLIFTDGTIATVDINMEKSKALKDSFTKPANAQAAIVDPYTTFTPAALWNTWCTYSVDANGVYTLTEVADSNDHFAVTDSGALYSSNKTDKVGQGRNNETADRGAAQGPADANGVINTIDKKQISLVSAIPSYTRVYGNDDTVYLIASTQKISDASYLKPGVGGQVAVIINDVDSTVTGVQNASLDVFGIAKTATLNSGKNTIAIDTDNNIGNGYEIVNTEANTSSGVYTLFSDKGYVIAAVVVGEDNGVSSTYAYVTSGVTQEDWRSSSSDWKWYRDVIVDGEEITLEEIGDSMSELKKMVQNNWYEVKFKADGTVKSVQLIAADNDDLTVDDYEFYTGEKTSPATTPVKGSYPKFVGLIEYVEQAQLDNNGKVVLFEDMTDNTIYKLDSTSNSFQVENAVTGQVSKGFSVSPNAKIVLVQDKEVISAAGNRISYSAMDIITTNYSAGGAGLAQALKYLNDNDEDGIFQGYVSAVFENGFATSVVIYETDPNQVNWGGSTGGSGEVKWINTSNINAPTYDGDGATPTDNDIYQLLLSLGYTNISKNSTTWSYTAPNGLSYSGVSIAPVGKFEVKINGRTLSVNSGALSQALNHADILGTTYNKATHGTYVKATYADKTTGYVDITSTPSISQSVSYEIGYYNIKVNGTVTSDGTNRNGGTITASGDSVTEGVFSKKVAGDVTLPVTVTNSTTTSGTVGFTADNGATVNGTIANGGTTATVNVNVSTTSLADDVTVALDDADVAPTINIHVNGVETEVEVGKKIAEIITGVTIPDSANAFVLVQELGYGDTAGVVSASNATTVKAGNYAIQATDTNLNIGNVEFTKYTAGSFTDNGVALSATTSVTDGEIYEATGGQKYITVGASVKTILTATADIKALGTWATYTTKMAIASDTTGDTVAYDANQTVTGWPAAAKSIENNTSFTAGTDSVLVARGEKFTVTHTGTAASETTFTIGNITVTAPAET